VKCSRKDCTRPAAWRIVMSLFPPGQPEFHAPIRLASSLFVCDDCRHGMKPTDVFGPEDWLSLKNYLAHANIAFDPDTALVSFEDPLDDDWVDTPPPTE
jgi:hypothetical protein